MKKSIFLLSCILMMSSTLRAQSALRFELKDLKNNTRSFNELKGEKITLLDFWASWCKPCLKAIPELNTIYSAYKDKGVEIIGINTDGPRSISKVVPLSKSLQIKYPVLIDIDAALRNELNVTLFPTLIMVNEKGEVLWTHEGFVAGDAEVIKSELDSQLKAL